MSETIQQKRNREIAVTKAKNEKAKRDKKESDKQLEVLSRKRRILRREGMEIED